MYKLESDVRNFNTKLNDFLEGIVNQRGVYILEMEESEIQQVKEFLQLIKHYEEIEMDKVEAMQKLNDKLDKIDDKIDKLFEKLNKKDK